MFLGRMQQANFGDLRLDINDTNKMALINQFKFLIQIFILATIAIAMVASIVS
jgi:hypothetical protein